MCCTTSTRHMRTRSRLYYFCTTDPSVLQSFTIHSCTALLHGTTIHQCAVGRGGVVQHTPTRSAGVVPRGLYCRPYPRAAAFALVARAALHHCYLRMNCYTNCTAVLASRCVAPSHAVSRCVTNRAVLRCTVRHCALQGLSFRFDSLRKTKNKTHV